MITVSIWRKTLVSRKACPTGLALFDAIASMQPESDPRRMARVRVGWTIAHQLWLATAYPEFSPWLRGEGLIPWIDLEGASLEGANLARANLEGARLEGANLEGANLVGAYLGRSQPPPSGWHTLASGYLGRDA
jgi:hypothetical protein